MKIPLGLLLFACAGVLGATPLDEASALLRAGDFPAAAAAFGALPPASGEPGQVAYLKALSLHLAGQQEPAIAAAGMVPSESPWGSKAEFLKAAALTKSKRHQEAEAIYAAAAARAFEPARRDRLVRDLLVFAEETMQPTAAGDVNPPPPDWEKAAALYEKVLDLPITAGLRAEVLLRKAMLYHEAGGQQAAAVATLNAWLLFCDPDWTLVRGADQLKPEAKASPNQRLEARLRLAENLLSLRRAGDARAVADELIARLQGMAGDASLQSLAGDAAWLRVRTFASLPSQSQRANLPNALQQQAIEVNDADQTAAQATGLALGARSELFANQVPFPTRWPNPDYDAADYLTELESFLRSHPAHPAAPSASAAIAATLEHQGKDLAAISGWQDFIAAKNFRFDATLEANRKQDPATGLTPAEVLARRQQSAAFRIGSIHFNQRRYQEAIRQWQQYITTWPNGAEWQKAQSGIVDAEFQIGLAAIAAENIKAACETFDAFLARYPLDPRARRILFIYGQIHYVAAQQLKETKAAVEATSAEFERAISEWARLISKYPGSEESSLALYNTALILTDELGRLDQGLAAFKRLTWGNWADPAKQRVALLNSKSLAVASERVFRLNETPTVKVSVRNIEKLKFSRYPLDVEAFFRSRHRIDAIDLLDIDLIAPETTWEVPVADYARYRSHQQNIPIPFPDGKPGACIVRVEGDDWQATTLVVRSDIDVLVESARREVLALVMKHGGKEPVANANVLVSDGEKIIASGQTGLDGVFRAMPVGIEKARSVRVLVTTPQGVAGGFLSLDGLALSAVPEKMARVFFARDFYEPGDRIAWYAIRRDVKDGTFPVAAAGGDWKWRAQLPNGRLLYEGPVSWSPEGVCSGEFVLPPSARDSLEGECRVRVFNGKESMQATFSVSTPGDLKRGWVVPLMASESFYLRGETVAGGFAARWANGLPIANQAANLTLPDGSVKPVTTDADGRVEVKFPLGSLKPGRYYMSLEVPTVDDAASVAITIAKDEFQAKFEKVPDLVMAGEPFDLAMKAVDYRGADFATPLTLTVLRRNPAKIGRILEGVPWLEGVGTTPQETPVASYQIAAGARNQQVSLPEPGLYVLKISGKDRQGNEITTETTLRAAGGADDSKLRLFSATTDVVAGQPFKLRIQSAISHPNALVTIHAQRFFSHQLVALSAGGNWLEIPVAAAQAPNFRVTVALLDGRQIHIASRPFEVRSGLKVALAAVPGTRDFQVLTTDPAGKPVAATVFTRSWNAAAGEPSESPGRVVVSARSTGLSLESSVTFSHPGTSRKLTNGSFTDAANDQVQLGAIQQAEINLNNIDSILLEKNRKFLASNSFLLVNNASKRGVFVINPGLKTMPQDALGVDVKILTNGITDLSWNPDRKLQRTGFTPEHATASASRRTPEHAQVATTDANGIAKFTTSQTDGAAVLAWAVDGHSLVAVDAMVIPPADPWLMRVLMPERVTPGQSFELPVLLTNRTTQASAPLSVECFHGAAPITQPLASLAAGATRVVRFNLLAPPKPGSTPIRITAGGVTWHGSLNIRDLTIPQILTQGGLFGPGEHLLKVPAADNIVGFRVIKAPDLTALPAASLNAAGELNDASEPQIAASDLLHVIAALTNAQDPTTKAALQERLAILTAEIAATEHDGGGWAWENIDISPGLLTTAFTWRSLLDARGAGAVVSDLMLKRTAAFVAGRYGGISAADFERKAVVLQAMAAAGTADFSLLNPLYRVRETLTPVALIRLCAAFIHAGREDEAKELLALAFKAGTAGKSPTGEDTLMWPGSKTVAGLNAPEEATAAALWCAAKLNPTAAETRQIANWLLNSPAVAPGGTTRCRGQVMQALTEFAKSLPRAAAADAVEVLADGKPITAPPSEMLPLPADGKLVVRVKGNAPAGVVVAFVQATPPDDPKSWEYPKIASRTYLHDNYRLGEIRLNAPSSSPVTQANHGQLVRVELKVANHPDETWQAHGNFLQIDEEIPSGCLFVEGSLSCDAQRVERIGNRLRLRYGPGTIGPIRYEMIALNPGTWTVPAAVLADPYDPTRCRRGTPNSLTILPPGEVAKEAYVMNRGEHLEAARRLFAANDSAGCLAQLDALAGAKLSQDEERDTAQMRLWLLAEQENADAKALIGAFELLTERHPRLVIPFAKLLRVGAGYRRLREFERAATVCRAALDGAFLADSGLGVALEDAGDYAGSVDYQEQLWREFPDSQDVIGSLSGLAQSLATRAPEAEKLPVRRGRAPLAKNELLARSRDLLDRFITLYPTDPQADDAAFSRVNVYFALKDYRGMVAAANAAAARHSASPFADSFKYLAALGYFWEGAFEQALAAAAPVANGDSKDRDYARYVTAQIYHAQGKPAEAIGWYQQVAKVYEDAAQAISLFEEKRVALPEVSIFKPGEPVKLTLDYRNIKEGAVQLYKVDLLKLYLREKSLSNITRVDLAGIAPQVGEGFNLGDGKDYVVKQKVLTLPVVEEGAYLAIVRGDHLFTSGLVLISPLKLDVKETPEGSVRVAVTDAATGKALADAEVKALGSASGEVRSGTTDPRGVFEVTDIRGTSTVIVKQGEHRYAFHRGTMQLGRFELPELPNSIHGSGGTGEADPFAAEPTAQPKGKVLEKGEYLKNIEESNKAVQQKQMQDWDVKRRSNSKGVEASDVMKK